jgi:hypothetical protein
MPMLPALADEGSKDRDVENVVAGMVELDRLAGDDEERFDVTIVLVADNLAEVRKGLAEIVTRSLLGVVRPEQPGQRVPPVRMVCLNGQIGQQRSCLVGGKVGDRFTVQGDLERA